MNFDKICIFHKHISGLNVVPKENSLKKFRSEFLQSSFIFVIFLLKEVNKKIMSEIYFINLRTADVSPRSSPLRDVSRGGTSATQRRKFHTDDEKSVQNPVRSANWSTEQFHCSSHCLQMTTKDKRRQRPNVNATNI